MSSAQGSLSEGGRRWLGESLAVGASRGTCREQQSKEKAGCTGPVRADWGAVNAGWKHWVQSQKVQRERPEQWRCDFIFPSP